MNISKTLTMSVLLVVAVAEGQRPTARRPIVLGPDDKAAYPAAPAGFDLKRVEIARGALETVLYESTTVGNKRNMLVYTPLGYSKDKTYPVLYLLHGLGGDDEEWHKNGDAGVILDNLCADGKATPMIVVVPNGRAQPDDWAVSDVFKHAKAFATFEKDLLKDLMPFMEKTYPVKKDAEVRAVAGLSMGGGQALSFGLGNLDRFSWVGDFSSAPNTRAPEELRPKPDDAKTKLKWLFIACGDKDDLIGSS
jgi:enterochelin esterase-like enzyme